MDRNTEAPETDNDLFEFDAPKIKDFSNKEYQTQKKQIEKLLETHGNPGVPQDPSKEKKKKQKRIEPAAPRKTFFSEIFKGVEKEQKGQIKTDERNSQKKINKAGRLNRLNGQRMEDGPNGQNSQSSPSEQNSNNNQFIPPNQTNSNKNDQDAPLNTSPVLTSPPSPHILDQSVDEEWFRKKEMEIKGYEGMSVKSIVSSNILSKTKDLFLSEEEVDILPQLKVIATPPIKERKERIKSAEFNKIEIEELTKSISPLYYNENDI